jgi:hypothetical protein
VSVERRRGDLIRSGPSRPREEPNAGFSRELIVERLTDIYVSAPAVPGAARRGEPVTVGLPMPRGVVAEAAALTLADEVGQVVPSQVRVLDRWSDGTIRWALFDFQADKGSSGDARYAVCADKVATGAGRPEGLAPTPVTHGGAPQGGAARRPAMHVSSDPRAIRVDVGDVQFVIGRRGAFHFRVRDLRARLAIADAVGRAWQVKVDSAAVEEEGPLRTAVLVRGRARRNRSGPRLDLFVRFHFFAGTPVVRVEATVRNPRRAVHKGGFWELGDPGSLHFRDISVHVDPVRSRTSEARSRKSDVGSPESGPGTPPGSVVRCSPERGEPLTECGNDLELYQDSSGRPNWHSVNHVNRHGFVPTSFRGYRLRAAGATRSGHCATPVVCAGGVTVTMRDFWENFPKAIEASPERVTLRLFPRQFFDTYELQGGEQKTHTFFLAFGDDDVADLPLDWCRSPLLARAVPAWYRACEVMPHLLSSEEGDLRHQRLIRAAVEGDNSFLCKRDTVDEYGWRNFGDLYADHEAAFHEGPEPLVSHYNNQYDGLAGCALQFMLSGDVRWWALTDDLARHTIDIDVYHTTEDKAAYNNGLFWHSPHYHETGRSTHRTYPRSPGIGGGGPACQHDYTSGLMLHYFLTGNALSRETVLDMAQWALDRDDGSKTVFKWLARGCTGLSSTSGEPYFHGPSRGPGNSVQTLLNGFRLTGERRFLDKVEELIARCVHPADDVRALDLLNAEMRWSYTVFLEALGRYLYDQAERGDLGRMYAYARASLLTYARWMAEKEYPYLDKPEILEYPDVTWPAQDMRKAEVFDLAALHASGDEQRCFRARAERFFRYSVDTLQSMPTHSLARPTVLMLSHGLARPWFRRNPDATLPQPERSDWDFGAPQVFVAQKVRAIRRAKAIVKAAALA